MNEKLRPSAAGREAERRARASLRVLPSPDSVPAGAERVHGWVAGGWARGAEQDDWCIDASSTVQAGCAATDLDVAAMSVSERRAVHMTRQRIRAQAVLAAAEPGSETGSETERRERARRIGIVAGSALLHLVGFALLAAAVADLRGKPRATTHEHLFEARAVVVPIEIEPALPAGSEQPSREAPAEAATEPTRARKPKPARRPKPTAEPVSEPEPHAAAPQELHGIEFSSEDEVDGREPGGGSGDRGSGSGSGSGSGGGSGDGGSAGSAGPTKADVHASPRGALIEPEYPTDLEREGIEGSVLVKVWIDEHGHVIKAEVANSSGHESFDHNALMAAQRQEWDAARVGGEPVASTRRYRMHFRQR